MILAFVDSCTKHFFFLLQTNPTYLAKLIFQMPQNKSTKFMDSVIFTLYNYASNQREEYLLLRLFQTALQEEIKYVVAYSMALLSNQFLQFLELRQFSHDVSCYYADNAELSLPSALSISQYSFL